MKVLVLGGAGYIASHTIIELLEAGHEAVIVDNFSNSHPEVLRRLETITKQEIPFYEIDILNGADLDCVFKEHEIDCVMHFAAYKAVGESVSHPLKYYHNNVEGTVQVLEAMERAGVRKLVYSSSATVYGADNPSPVDEGMPANTATNPYGYSKIINEHLLHDMVIADPRWSVAILRYFNPLGAHPSGLIGEDPQGIPNNIMPYITQVAVGKLPLLKIFGDDYPTPDGTGVRDYIHVLDLAQGHIATLDALKAEGEYLVYNLGTGRGYSVLELVHAFEEASGKDIPYEITQRRPGDIAEVYGNVDKVQRELGWKAQLDLNDMCRDSWHWQVNNPQGYVTDDRE